MAVPRYTTGIIASKRCNNVQIYNNTVYDGDQVGIFLHRSSDDATVYYNNIYNNKDAGIAFMESFGGKIFNNTITNCKYGLRLSLGAEENTFMHNTMTDIGLDPGILFSRMCSAFSNWRGILPPFTFVH